MRCLRDKWGFTGGRIGQYIYTVWCVLNNSISFLDITTDQIWNFARSREHCSQKNSFRLWKDLWNSSKLGCGSKFFQSFPENVVLFPHIGIFKANFHWFDEFILSTVAINKLKIPIFLRKSEHCQSRGRIIQNSMSGLKRKGGQSSMTKCTEG